MDVLINRLRNAGIGCKLAQQFVGCVLYADDILLLAHSLNAVRQMLRICEEFATEFDMKFNSSKSVVMRIGERYKVKCEPLMFLFLFFSRPRSEGWPHHGRTFSIYPCPLSF